MTLVYAQTVRYKKAPLGVIILCDACKPVGNVIEYIKYIFNGSDNEHTRKHRVFVERRVGIGS